MVSKWERPESFINFHGNTKPRPHDPNLLTISEVANILRVSMLTLKRWEKKGHIKAIRINSRGDRRYLRTEIERILEGKSNVR